MFQRNSSSSSTSPVPQLVAPGPILQGLQTPSLTSRASSNCTGPIQPPADCNGNGAYNAAACTCNCVAGFVNDLSNLVSPQWCKADTANPDGRPGVSPVPAPTDGSTPTTNLGRTGGGGFTTTRMFYIILAVLLAGLLACIIWCYIRLRRRRARREKKRKRGRRSRKRRSTSTTSSATGSTESSSFADDSSSSSGGGKGTGRRGSSVAGSRASKASRGSQVARSKGSGSSRHLGRSRASESHGHHSKAGRKSSKAGAGLVQMDKSHEKKRPKLSNPDSPAAAAAEGSSTPWGLAGMTEGDLKLTLQQRRRSEQMQRYGGWPLRPNFASSSGGREGPSAAAAGARSYQTFAGSAGRSAHQQEQHMSGIAAEPYQGYEGGDDYDLRQVQVVVDATGAQEQGFNGYKIPWGSQQQQQQQRGRERMRSTAMPASRRSVLAAAVGGSGGVDDSEGGRQQLPFHASIHAGAGAAAAAAAAAAMAAKRARLAGSPPGVRSLAGGGSPFGHQQQWQQQQQQQQRQLEGCHDPYRNDEEREAYH